MAQDTSSQKIGRRGQSTVWRIFEDLGFVCNTIANDFGEDFFVLGEQDGYIEPFKVFVQVKASEAFDTYPSDWTEYCDPFTVRNWILSNEMTIVVRANLQSGELRYAIPEDDCGYWDIDYKKQFAVRLERPFDAEAAAELIWAARIRHYDRLFRLTLPNPFEVHEHQGVQHFRLFLFEFLNRIKIFDKRNLLTHEFVDLYQQLFEETRAECGFTDKEDMTAHEQVRFATCLRVLLVMIQTVSGHRIGLKPLFLSEAACVLVQFAIDAENSGTLPTS